jgi:hypothetical protein
MKSGIKTSSNDQTAIGILERELGSRNPKQISPPKGQEIP